MGSYWWYITLFAPDAEDGRLTTGDCACGESGTNEANEEILSSAAEISGSIGTEVQEVSDGTRMRIYYRSDQDLSHWRTRLMDALAAHPGVRVEDIGKIENQPWTTQSEEAFPPLAVGQNLVVLAPWHMGTEPAGRVPLYINPGSAFGTGYHESTQVALELFEHWLGGPKGKPDGFRALDIGTGSGILTVAAMKLGASSARARDVDPAVIDEAQANFALNGVDGKAVRLETGDLLQGVGDTFDVVFANILLDPLLEMIPDVDGILVPGGVAIFSGMTERERDHFLEALAATPLQVVDELVKEEWWGVVAQTPA